MINNNTPDTSTTPGMYGTKKISIRRRKGKFRSSGYSIVANIQKISQCTIRYVNFIKNLTLILRSGFFAGSFFMYSPPHKMRKKKNLKAKPSEKKFETHDRVTSVAELMKIASDTGKGIVGSCSILIPEKELSGTINILKNQ